LDFKFGDYVIVLGREAWRRLRLPGAIQWWGSYYRNGTWFALAPHPSGRSLAYNDKENRLRLANLLQRLTERLDVQGRR
jgi:hypothetical protein